MAASIQRIDTCNLRPGMKLANALMSDAHSLLVAEKTLLTQLIIDRIRHSGMRYVDIMVDANSETLAARQPEPPKLVEKQLKMVRSVKESFDRMRLTRALPHEEFLTIANEISTTMIDTPGAITALQMVKSVDNYTYTHSVNVGVLCGLIGKWTGHQNLQGLILAGLLHDVGKTQIPLEILNKPSALTSPEMTVMRRHSELGYELAMGNGSINEEAMSGILFHHERLDGSGYPSGLRGSQVPQVSRVLAVADLFDSMTSNRVYRSAVTPFAVLEEIYDEMFSALDPAVCFVFRQRIKELLVGSKVLLSDGRSARIIFIDGNDHFKPVLQDEMGQSFQLDDSTPDITRFVSG